MKLKSALIIAALGIGVSVGTAGTVKISNVSGAPAALSFRDDAGAIQVLGEGSIGIGTFGIDNAAIGGFAGADEVDVRGLLANFTQFADSVSVGFNGTAGLYETTIAQALNSGDAFVGNKVYTVVGNGSTLAGSTSLLVVEDEGSFLADPSLMDAINLNGDKNVVVGEFLADPSPFGGGSLVLAGMGIIPEPSSVMLLLSGVALMAGRRRR